MNAHTIRQKAAKLLKNIAKRVEYSPSLKYESCETQCQWIGATFFVLTFLALPFSLLATYAQKALCHMPADRSERRACMLNGRSICYGELFFSSNVFRTCESYLAVLFLILLRRKKRGRSMWVFDTINLFGGGSSIYGGEWSCLFSDSLNVALICHGSKTLSTLEKSLYPRFDKYHW